MKRRFFLKSITVIALFSGLLPRILKSRRAKTVKYPGPLKDINLEEIKQEGPWAG